MKLAVTYANGEVFQHFGHTETFKIYEIEQGQVISAQVVDTNGSGHEALADFLAARSVSVLLCGGIGGGAEAALTGAGIQIFSGAQGDADAAVQAWLNGELEAAGANCDHHDHDHEEEGCGGNCHGCHGGCHSVPGIEGPNVGKRVRTHYRGTLNDGTVFDSSYDRGEPLEFICGAGMMIRGYDEAVAKMELGQSVDIHLTPDQAYGEIDPRAIFTVQISQMPARAWCSTPPPASPCRSRWWPRTSRPSPSMPTMKWPARSSTSTSNWWRSCKPASANKTDRSLGGLFFTTFVRKSPYCALFSIPKSCKKYMMYVDK